jgi:NifU-like protein involved in Fe-S cluster formation
MYSAHVRHLLKTLPNRGSCPEATHRGKAENPICGDVIEFQLEIRGGVIVDCCFRAYGCPGALAAAAALSEKVKGEHQDSCRKLSTASLLDVLEGLPRQKHHGVDLAVTAFHDALIGL